MPTYEYECKGCGKRFDVFQRLNEPAAARCPECGGEATRIVGAGVAILGGRTSRRRSLGDSACSREFPCCGRAEPCEKKPCE